MKSAYELALERMAASGIEPPREDALDDAGRAAIAEARSKAEAELAHLEILHRQQLAKLEYGAREQAEEEYRIDRARVEARRDREIEAVRSARGKG